MKNAPNMYRINYENSEGQLVFQDLVTLAGLNITDKIKAVTPIFIEVNETSLTSGELVKQVKLDTVEQLKMQLEIAEKDLKGNLEIVNENE